MCDLPILFPPSNSVPLHNVQSCQTPSKKTTTTLADITKDLGSISIHAHQSNIEVPRSNDRPLQDS